MCLDTVLSVYRKPRMKVVDVYKVMVTGRKTKFRTPFRDAHLPLNKWISLPPTSVSHITSTRGKHYPAGFHVYTNVYDAEKSYRSLNGIHDGRYVVKCKARAVVCCGFEKIYDPPDVGDVEVLVCREIKLLRESGV